MIFIGLKVYTIIYLNTEEAYAQNSSNTELRQKNEVLAILFI